MKRKILFYIKDPNGGTGRFLEQIQKLIKSIPNIECKIISHIEPKGFFLKTKQIGYAIEKQRDFSIKNFLIVCENFFSLLAFVNRYSPDIIFTLDLYANLSGILLKLLKRKYYLIISTHINIDKHIIRERNPLFSKFLKLLVSFLYRFADLHITPSQELKDNLINQFRINSEKVVFIPYFFYIKEVKKLADKNISDRSLKKELSVKSSVKIFSMGRFEEQKDFKNLLYAFSKLIKMYPNLQLYLLGRGKLELDYRNLSEKLKIDDRVFFLGWQKNLYKFLKFADIFVLVTNFESFSYSLIEALSLNIPIICSDVDFGPREVLGFGRYGILLKDNLPINIIKSVRLLIYNKRLYLRFKHLAYKRAQQYDVSYIGPKYKKVFLNILNKSPKTK